MTFLPLAGAALAAALVVGQPDPVGDVRGGHGPDIAAVAVSSTRTTVTFRVRMTTAPPLRANSREQWVDMILVAVDVPPFGPPPVVPGGEWRGADFALGTHGPSRQGQLVRNGKGSPLVARFPVVVRGATVVLTVSRRALGDPASLRYSVAAAREAADEANGGYDVAPDRGTAFVRLAA